MCVLQLVLEVEVYVMFALELNVSFPEDIIIAWSLIQIKLEYISYHAQIIH